MTWAPGGLLVDFCGDCMPAVCIVVQTDTKTQHKYKTNTKIIQDKYKKYKDKDNI